MRFDQKSVLTFAIMFVVGGGIAFVSAEYSAFVPVVTALVLLSAAMAAMKWVQRSSKE